MTEKYGSMVLACLPVYDWVIPDFLNLTKAIYGPDFIILGKTFFILLENNNSTGDVRVWLGRRSKDPITVDHFAFSLASKDGSELDFGSRSKATITDIFINRTKEDASFQKTCLQPKFIHNGELHIRCRIQTGPSQEEKMWKPILDSSIVNDLSLQFAEQALSFTDIVLGCGKKEYPVHRFMLATRSPVFKAMFSHEETLEGQKGKVEHQYRF
jgi:hypothetical protein